jgi:hypothetical protein
MADPELSTGLINPDWHYPESTSASACGLSLAHHRRLRRKDQAEGTPGKRTPRPTWMTERRVVFRGCAILAFWAQRDRLSGHAAGEVPPSDGAPPVPVEPRPPGRRRKKRELDDDNLPPAA